MAQKKYELLLVVEAQKLIINEQPKELPQIEYNLTSPYLFEDGKVLLVSEGHSKYAILYADVKSFQEMINSMYYPIPDELLDHHYRDLEKIKNLENNVDYYLNYLFSELKIDRNRELNDELCQEMTRKFNKMTWEERINISLSVSVYLGYLKKKQDKEYEWHYRIIKSGFNLSFDLSLHSENNTISLDYIVDRYLFSNQNLKDFTSLMRKAGIKML